MKKRILFILHIPPPVHGSSVIGLQIKNSIILNDKFECSYINLGTSTSIDEIGKRGFTKLFRFGTIWFNVLSELIKFKPELCYFAITAKGPAFYKDALIAVLIKIFGVKLVYHFHNKGVSVRQDKWIDNLIYSFVFKNSDAILLSKFLYQDVQKYIPKERVYYCPNGIPDVVGNKVMPLKSHYKTVQILFLSNLIETKGVFVLLDACALLHQKQVSFNCVFVGGNGDVNEEQFAEQAQKLNLASHVSYLGKKYGNEKDAVFENADIFVFPTFYHNETFGLVNLEAMQYSIPVISTFEGGIPDVIEDGVTGFLVQQKDAQALADKLEILINNPELSKQMGALGRQKYEKEFTLNTFETTLTSIFDNILK